MIILSWAEKMAPYVIGFLFSVVFGHYIIWNTTEELWKSVGQPRQSPDPLHKDPWLPAQVGMLERFIYFVSILAGKEQFVAVWLGLKAISSWNIWNRSEDDEGRSRIPGRSVFNIFLIGNALSVAYGVTAGWITKCWLDQSCDVLKIMSLVSGLLILTAIIWCNAIRYQKRRSK